ncbi:MAG: hypothetical protein KAT05_10970 [Spirochaetes bacterium]|nr:hypothetical protein [Spirochaetota bacterium]
MIEKMKKLSLLIYHNSKEKFLENLQSLGVVHLEANTSIQNEDILIIEEKIINLKKAEDLLINISNFIKHKFKQESYNGNIEQLLEDLHAENKKLDDLNNNLDDVNKEISLLSPWGNFDPENIKRLSNIGITLKFYSTAKSKFNKLNIENLPIEIICQLKGYVYFVLFYREGETIEELDAREEKIPIKSLKTLYKDSGKVEKEIQKQKEILTKYTKYLDVIKQEKISTEDKLSYNIANASLLEEVEGKVLLINGWMPERQLKKVEAFLQNEDAAYIVENPKEEDDVPILLRNGPFARLFEPITKIFGLPSYVELDTTPFFAPFFAAFFGLCLADTGYGLVLFLSIIAVLVFIKNKSIRPIAYLGIVLSLTTMVGGFVLNTFFGIKFTEMTLLSESMKKWIIFSDINDAMSFAIMLGVIQVLLGFTLQTINKVKRKGFTAGLQPIGTMLLLLGGIILGVIYGMEGDFSIGPFPVKKIMLLIPQPMSVGLFFVIMGVILVMLFNNIDKKVFIRPLFGLWEIYGLLTGVPGDILSYIRLFALGLAGGLLGSAFNNIAFMVRGDTPSIIGYIGMILIMVFGHSINLGLAALSAFVHPLRLVFLEFYKAVDFTGGGREYSPFKNKIILKNK